MNCLKYAGLIFVISMLSSAVFGQSPQRDSAPQFSSLRFDSFVNRPELGIAITTKAKLKIALRKERYVPGETVILDVAMLISPQEIDYYFPTLDTLVVKVEDNSGKSINVNPFMIVDKRFSALRRKYGLELHSVSLLIGCRKSDLSFPIGIDDVSSDQELFEKGLFITKGDGCIDFTDSGNYRIFVEISNDKVVIPAEGRTIQTVVGRIQSNSLDVVFRR